MRNNRYYSYIIQMIEESGFEDRRLLNMFLSEDPYNKKSLYYMIQEVAKFTESAEVDVAQAYQILTEALYDYVFAYSTSHAIKRRLCSRILDWCKHMGEQYSIENYNEYLEELRILGSADIAVEIVKELHNQDGISKLGLAGKYSISEKKAQIYLSKIDNQRCSDPIRIGGQAVYVPISRKKSNKKEEPWKYYTTNTMSPLVFQMNIMQVETLMKSLQLNYSEGNDIPLDLAIDTWSQLSEYARNRIRKIFGERDAQLSEFLDEVEEKMYTDGYRFMTESEIMKKYSLSYHEKLEIAYKGDMVCNISLLDSQHITRKNQRIRYDHDRNSFYAVPADKLNAKRLYFTEDEINVIEEA